MTVIAAGLSLVREPTTVTVVVRGFCVAVSFGGAGVFAGLVAVCPRQMEQHTKIKPETFV
jgi:hypothetical protein